MTRALAIARRELALEVREATGRNDGTPAERYAFGDAVPWCAAFVAYCFREAGAPLPGNRWRIRAVAELERELEAAGARVAAPRPGCVVTFNRRGASDAGAGRHCGIVEAVAGDELVTIEGNVANAVRRQRHRRDDASIAGFFAWGDA